MKKLVTVLMLIMAISVSALFAEIPVTFQIDMTVKTLEGIFVPGEDNVTVRGDFMSELGKSDDWSPDEGPYVLADEDADTIYTLTLNFPDSTDGMKFFYKYQINDIVWENMSNNHEFTVASPSTDIPIVFFENDEVVTLMSVNFVHITLDLTSFYGSGLGHFDPSTDSIKIEGFWGDGVGAELSDDKARWCKENVWQPGLFETIIIVQAEEGKKPEFKAHAFPQEHFENSGWETGGNTSFTILGDSQDVYINYVPSIVPKLEPLTSDLTILFSVDVSQAKNRWLPDVLVDPSTITHVGLKGQHQIIGDWDGDWTLADTTEGYLTMLNDDGLNGDKTAGDNIWSKNVTFPAGVVGGPCLYKYSIYYPGADTLNSFDNEMHTQDDNHEIFISPDNPTEMNDIFGWPSVNGVPVGVDPENKEIVAEQIHLYQNYPNPFNPTTNIAFQLTTNKLVNIAVYNVLGQKVETLVNKHMVSGYHKIQFDGSQLASGVYFIRLQSAGQIQMKKMMLLK